MRGEAKAAPPTAAGMPPKSAPAPTAPPPTPVPYNPRGIGLLKACPANAGMIS